MRSFEKRPLEIFSVVEKKRVGLEGKIWCQRRQIRELC